MDDLPSRMARQFTDPRDRHPGQSLVIGVAVAASDPWRPGVATTMNQFAVVFEQP